MEKQKSWFEVWFNSPFYHILYKNRDIHEATTFIDNLIKKANVEYGTILDLACGKGRHANYLAEKGFDVTGIDLSRNSIEFANEMYQLENLEFFIHDMRLPFRINYYDYVLNLFTSLGYFKNLKDNEKVFESVHLALKEGGYFLIDFMNTELVINNLVEREEKNIDGIDFFIRREVYEGKIIKHIKIEKDEKEVHLFKEEVQALMPHHFHQFLNNSHFTLVDEFGDYNFNKFNAKTSPRYIVLAKKLNND